MKLVMDTLFLEHLCFPVSAVEAVPYRTCVSLQETFEGLCAHIGLELIDYSSGVVIPAQDRVIVHLYSKSWEQRVARHG